MILPQLSARLGLRQGQDQLHSEEIITQSEAYLASCEDEELERGSDERPVYSLKVKLPTIEGLARHFQRHRLNEPTFAPLVVLHIAE